MKLTNLYTKLLELSIDRAVVHQVLSDARNGMLNNDVFL